MAAESTKDDGKPCAGKASSDSPALKPYRGKPAVRNFRGGDGNVGIIRSPVRAIALPDSFGDQVSECLGNAGDLPVDVHRWMRLSNRGHGVEEVSDVRPFLVP
jgi:hypothetical protein